MKISYEKMDRKRTLVIAEADTLSELIENLQLSDEDKKDMLSKMPDDYTVHEVGLYLYVDKCLKVIETIAA